MLYGCHTFTVDILADRMTGFRLDRHPGPAVPPRVSQGLLEGETSLRCAATILLQQQQQEVFPSGIRYLGSAWLPWHDQAEKLEVA